MCIWFEKERPNTVLKVLPYSPVPRLTCDQSMDRVITLSLGSLVSASNLKNSTAMTPGACSRAQATTGSSWPAEGWPSGAVHLQQAKGHQGWAHYVPRILAELNSSARVWHLMAWSAANHAQTLVCWVCWMR